MDKNDLLEELIYAGCRSAVLKKGAEQMDSISKPARPDLYESHMGKGAPCPSCPEKDAELTRLRAIVAKAGDVGGIADQMESGDGIDDMARPSTRGSWREGEGMTDHDVPYDCACCGKMTTNYLCGRCAKGNYSNDIDALRSERDEYSRAMIEEERLKFALCARLVLAEKVAEVAEQCPEYLALSHMKWRRELRSALAAWKESK